jgi:hypothetical protein
MFYLSVLINVFSIFLFKDYFIMTIALVSIKFLSANKV